MKIGIDTRTIQFGENRGISVYVTQLLRELEKDNSNEYLRCALPRWYINFKNINKSYVPRRILDKLEKIVWLLSGRFIKQKAAHNKISIFHATHPLFILPSTKKFRSIATIYDIIPLLFPEKYRIKTAYGRFLYKKAIAALPHLDRIITLSYTSRNDICRILGIPKEKITPIYLGVQKGFFPITDIGRLNKVKQKYNIKGKYILNVGGVDYRKNILSLLEAFAQLIKKSKKSISLVLTGSGIFLNKEQKVKIFNKIRDLNLENFVTICGLVPFEDLVLLYNGAELLCFPSLYEGFGLPIVEAMACGTPVVTSSTPSLAETAGDAALLINPQNPEEIAKGMYKVLTDKNLREALIKKGLERASKFSWEKTARETLKVYEEVAHL